MFSITIWLTPRHTCGPCFHWLTLRSLLRCYIVRMAVSWSYSSSAGGAAAWAISLCTRGCRHCMSELSSAHRYCQSVLTSSFCVFSFGQILRPLLPPRVLSDSTLHRAIYQPNPAILPWTDPCIGALLLNGNFLCMSCHGPTKDIFLQRQASQRQRSKGQMGVGADNTTQSGSGAFIDPDLL